MNRKGYKKIIFIDGDTTLVNTYISGLKQKNLSDYLIHCKNGEEGLDYLENIKNKEEFPDYILLDFYMPQMDGFQFLKHLEGLTSLNDSAEIYVCSSSRKKDDRDKVMKFPFVSAYLEKPLSSDFIELLIKDSV